MAYYMIQAAFTPESWAKLVKNPQDRREAIRPMIEKLDGRLEGYWLAFGDYDAVVIAQVPDNVTAAALSLAAAAGARSGRSRRRRSCPWKRACRPCARLGRPPPS